MTDDTSRLVGHRRLVAHHPDFYSLVMYMYLPPLHSFLSLKTARRARALEDGSSTVTCSHFLDPSYIVCYNKVSYRVGDCLGAASDLSSINLSSISRDARPQSPRTSPRTPRVSVGASHTFWSAALAKQRVDEIFPRRSVAVLMSAGRGVEDVAGDRG